MYTQAQDNINNGNDDKIVDVENIKRDTIKTYILKFCIHILPLNMPQIFKILVSAPHNYGG